MSVAYVLHLVDEFGRAMRDEARFPGSIAPAVLNQQRDRLHAAIRALANGELQQELDSADAADAAIAAARKPEGA